MSEKKADPAGSKRIGMVQQKQKGYFALRLHAVGGDFTADQMRKVAEIAQRFGKGQIHLTTRQGIEIHFVHETNLETAREELESAGVLMGAGGPRVRIVTACPGEATCRRGIIDTKEVAHVLDKAYFGQEVPYKFKIAVTGCPNNCAKASENDVGVMGGIRPAWEASSCTDCGLCTTICPTHAITKTDASYAVEPGKCINCSICTSTCPAGAWTAAERGYILWLGGTLGKTPRLATRVPGLITSKERLYAMIDRAIAFYRETGRKKERFGHTMDRVGIDEVIKTILSS